MSFHEGSKWQEQNEDRKKDKQPAKSKTITSDNYALTNAGISVERVSHFASDSIGYVLVLNTKGTRLAIDITVSNFNNLKNIGVDAYENSYNPVDGAKLTKL